jgi:hypothetical protein
MRSSWQPGVVGEAVHFQSPWIPKITNNRFPLNFRLSTYNNLYRCPIFWWISDFFSGGFPVGKKHITSKKTNLFCFISRKVFSAFSVRPELAQASSTLVYAIAS